MAVRTLLLVISCLKPSSSVQKFKEAPTYREVNPGGEAVLECIVENKKGECRWEKDGSPVGMYDGKYEWYGNKEEGDCSLRVKEASIEYDNGVWQCQVTASDFTQRDTLISEGAELVVRGENIIKKYFLPPSISWVYLPSFSCLPHLHLQIIQRKISFIAFR